MPRHLERVLASLEMQTVARQMEVVISDDGSADETPEVARRFAEGAPFPVKFITHPHRAFELARCRNEGLRAASAPLAVFLDGDCIAPPDHVEQHLRRLRRGTVADPALRRMARTAAALALGASFDAAVTGKRTLRALLPLDSRDVFGGLRHGRRPERVTDASVTRHLFASGRDQPAARLFAVRGLLKSSDDHLVVDGPRETVRAEEEDVARGGLEQSIIDLDAVVGTDRAREHVSHCSVGRRPRMIPCQLDEAAAPIAIQAAVADVRDVGAATADPEDDHGRAHARARRVLGGGLPNTLVRVADRLEDALPLAFGLPERPKETPLGVHFIRDRLDRELTRHLAGGVSAHSVSDDREAALGVGEVRVLVVRALQTDVGESVCRESGQGCAHLYRQREVSSNLRSRSFASVSERSSSIAWRYSSIAASTLPSPSRLRPR